MYREWENLFPIVTTIAIAIAMAIAITIDFERRGIRDWKSIDFLIKSIEKASILSARTPETGNVSISYQNL